jgi:hypothetical protein
LKNPNLRRKEKLRRRRSKKKQYHVNVLGFNSRKFDTNLFIRNISGPNINIEKLIGGIGDYKSLIISHKLYPFNLQFLDIKLFLGTGTLDENVRAFKLKENKLKFPYEVLNQNNFFDNLQMTEPFKHEQLNSSLSKSNISDE